MKRSFKVSALCLFAVLLAGCLPQQRLTGRVIDTAGPVPGAAVLAMVWIEDASKALPAPDIRNLAKKDLDIILEKDMKDRGLPAAYARAFADGNGMFDLDTLHFSAETKKAVKVMAQPKISRITLNAFQRGYLKHAATVFPKDVSKELSPAVVRLSKPESWKQLALDNPFRTLRRDEYDQGYSKEFGASKAEKKWFLDYISSNLNEAYQASNIKGDKQWEEDCGRDFSDIVISSSGMQRNPNHEKCNELLREMGVLRDWEKLWVDHSYAPDARQTPAINAIKEAVNTLEAEFAEIKQYEAQIIAGAEEAAKEYTAQAQKNLRDGLSETSPLPPEAQNLYRNGDKAGAYKALGHALYRGLPAELKQGIVTAMLPAITLPRIKETTVGFYLLQNRPLTAQLPGGDGGNHKDKPGYKVEFSTEVVADTAKILVQAKEPRIALEEKEITFLDENGKGYKTIRTSKYGHDDIKAFGEIQQLALKRIGANSLKEVNYGKLTDRYGDVVKKISKSTPIVPGRLSFYASDGSILKTIVLSSETIKTKIIEKGKERIVETQVHPIAFVSENGKFALINNSRFEKRIGRDGKSVWWFGTGRFSMYDNTGKKLFEKEYSKDVTIADGSKSSTVLSNSGIANIMTALPGSEADSDLVLYVYDKNGKELLVLPNQNLGYSPIRILGGSPNGKYIAVEVHDGVKYFPIFFDVVTGEHWTSDDNLIVRSVGDDGVAKVEGWTYKGKIPDSAKSLNLPILLKK